MNPELIASLAGRLQLMMAQAGSANGIANAYFANCALVPSKSVPVLILW